jgi:hypothetical protein
MNWFIFAGVCLLIIASFSSVYLYYKYKPTNEPQVYQGTSSSVGFGGGGGFGGSGAGADATGGSYTSNKPLEVS